VERSWEECLGDDVENARTSAEKAGWDAPADPDLTAHWQARLDQRIHPKWDSFSWLTVRALYESVNDVFAKAGRTIVRGRRARWVTAIRAAGLDRPRANGRPAGHGEFGADFVIDWTGLERPRFILMGDPGEADASQYAVIDPLLAAHCASAPGLEGGPRTDFMVIVSDVIYPAGDVNEYVNAFYLPYRDYNRPIYALPGNHDWYDGLNGFMFNFCAAEPMPDVRYRRLSYGPGEQAARLMWRGPARPDRDALAPWIKERARRAEGAAPGGANEYDPDLPYGIPSIEKNKPPPAPGRRPVQPAPYFAIDAGPVRLVSIDTGVSGELDAEQGEWLRRVSSDDPRPKILLTGKPIYVNNEYHPCQIVWKEESREAGGTPPRDEERLATADDIVRRRTNNYVAAIGGDIHNYQRYPVHLEDERTIQYIVSGGGGAYLSPTHTIPKVGPTCKQGLPPDVTGFNEDEFRCYPLRGDSLTLYARSAGPLLFKLILSGPVLVAATLAMMFLVLGGLDDRRLPVIWGSLVGAVVVILIAGGFIARDMVIARTTPGYRALLLGGLAAMVGLAVAAVMLECSAEANAAAAIALGVPFAIVTAMMLAYTLRGSRPEYAPALLVVLPLVAVWEIFRPFDLDGGWALTVYVLFPVAFLIFAVWLTERARIGLPRDTFLKGHRIAVIGAWTGLAVKVLADQAEPAFLRSTDWLTWTVLVLIATGLLVGRAIPHLTPQPHRPHQSDRSALRDAATSAVLVTLIALALHALAQIGDGWPAKVTALAVSTFAGTVGALLSLGLVALIRANPLTLKHLRTGIVDSASVAEYVGDRIAVPPTRPVGSDETDQQKRGMVQAIWSLGRGVAEIGESNDPPFYKSFLVVDAADDAVVIRCYGVTGYGREPTLEDCIRIPFET
jgi:hypothetical protein